MRGINHLKELVENIKKTEEMISLHKDHDELDILITQYEDLKAKQVAELIDELTLSPFPGIESLSIIKLIIDKYYPLIKSSDVKQRELKELALSI
ncbi:hypothetical protein [Mucilaginibacter sp.]